MNKFERQCILFTGYFNEPHVYWKSFSSGDPSVDPISSCDIKLLEYLISCNFNQLIDELIFKRGIILHLAFSNFEALLCQLHLSKFVSLIDHQFLSFGINSDTKFHFFHFAENLVLPLSSLRHPAQS